MATTSAGTQPSAANDERQWALQAADGKICATTETLARAAVTEDGWTLSGSPVVTSLTRPGPEFAWQVCDPLPAAVGASPADVNDDTLPAELRRPRPHCDTCSDTGRVPHMIEADPYCYIEADSDGMVPCPDCST